MKTLIVLLLATSFSAIQAQTATDIVKKADAKLKGEKSSYTEMNMTIVRPTWERTVGFKSWTLGTKKSMAYMTSPAKEKGQAFLRNNREMWSWNPSISRMIKLPPSMLSQGWMGSDFTNDDLLNESSIVVDYEHKLLGNEDVSGKTCYKIELIPKEDAPVVWGKIVLWITHDEYIQIKAEYYDEDEFLMKTEVGSNFKTMGGRIIPTYFELIPANKDGHKTLVEITSASFNQDISESFFTQQNMKRIR
jgi:outer membrane lipoprotein-sorting protein